MKQKTVFLIDDDEEDLKFMRDVMSRVDSSILCASFERPEEAIRVLQNDLKVLPDYIFIDINMPKITGEDCLRRLRSNSKFDATPIILYSTSMPSYVAQKLLQAGADFTFAKPNTESGYFEVLQSIIFGNSLQTQRALTNRDKIIDA